MAAVNPLTKQEASAEVHDLYDKLTHVFGHMPNIFGVMARRPAALQHFMALYGAVVNSGTVDVKLKELAYLKTSRVNGCQY